MTSGGEFLMGSRLLVKLTEKESMILSIQKLLGLGDHLAGKALIEDMIQSSGWNDIRGLDIEEALDASAPIEDMIQTSARNIISGLYLKEALNASAPNERSSETPTSTFTEPRGKSMAVWLVIMADNVCNHQLERLERLGSNDKPQQPISEPVPYKYGECWRYAFGDMFSVDFSRFGHHQLDITDFTSITDLLDSLHTATNQIRNQLPLNKYECVTCELTEFMLAIGATDYLIIKELVILRGKYNLAVRVGTWTDLKVPLWHVCSAQETGMFYADATQFAEDVGKATFEMATHRNHSDPFKEGLVCVGALLSPGICTGVDADGYFQAPFLSGRTLLDVTLRSRFNQRVNSVLSKIGGGKSQTDIKFDAGFLQVSQSVSGEISEMLKENEEPYSLSRGIDILERSRKEIYLVYEASSGRVTAQKLLCIASSILGNMTGFATKSPGGIQSWYRRLNNVSRQGQSENVFELARHWRVLLAEARQARVNGQESTFAWGLVILNVIHFCNEALNKVSPIIRKNGRREKTIGGLDLSNWFTTEKHWRVWEIVPKPEPSWISVSSLGTLPCIAVDKLQIEKQVTPLTRATLVVPIPVLERLYGPLREKRPGELVFYSVGRVNRCIKIELNGVDNELVSGPEFVQAASLAVKLPWDRVYVPVERLGNNILAIIQEVDPENSEGAELAETMLYNFMELKENFISLLLEL